MASDYVRGEMDVSAQKDMFSGFMSLTVWSSILILASVLGLTLIFVVGMNWMTATIIGAAVSVVLGLALQMKTAWYMTVAGLTVTCFIIGFISMGIGWALGL